MSHREDTAYLSVSTRVHAMENRLLTRERMERMIAAKDDVDAAKVLSECGYGELSSVSASELERLLSNARADIVRELSGAVPDKRLVEIFQIKYDYHNIKVILKAEAMGVDGKSLLLAGGRYDPVALLEGYQRDELREVTPVLREAITRAKETLNSSSDPQLADFLLDKAYYREMTLLAQELESTFLQGYVRLATDVANLRSAVRAARLDKGADFLRLALIPGGNVSEQSIAAARGDELASLFQLGALAQAAAACKGLAQPGGGSLTEFERLCDNALTEYLGGARRIAFGEEPIIGYLYARELEITAIRTIMSGRMAGLSGDVIRSRLRATYA